MNRKMLVVVIALVMMMSFPETMIGDRIFVFGLLMMFMPKSGKRWKEHMKTFLRNLRDINGLAA